MYIKIDLCGAYNLVCIWEGDKWNATFKTHYNHFEYVVIPFGFTNMPVVFQHLRKDVFHEYLNDFFVYYINDILIFSNNMEDHKRHVCLGLEKLWEVGLYAKLEKCEFHQSKWNFWIMSFFKMTFAWILIRFKPLSIGLLQLLFEISNVLLDLPTFIEVSLPNIIQ